MTKQVPFTGGEKESLHAALDRHRDVVLRKISGLDDEQLRRPSDPVGHEPARPGQAPGRGGVRLVLPDVGRPTEPLPFDDDDENADLRVEPHESTADVVAFYGRARAASDAVIDELDVEHLGTAWFGEQVTLRWVLIHMVEETARHAGHMDIVRESIDGATGV